MQRRAVLLCAWVLAVWGQEAVDLSPEFAEDCREGSCPEHEDSALLQSASAAVKPRGRKPSYPKDKKHPGKKPGTTKEKEKTPDSSYKITVPDKKPGNTKDKEYPGKTPDKEITVPGKKLGHTKDKKYPGKKPGKKLGHGKSKKGRGKKPAYHKTMKARMSMPAQEEDQPESPQAPEESEAAEEVPGTYDPSLEVPEEGLEQPESEMPESV
mmetsp:Transcript_38837/g.92870  ORF Transcript_38837/g.92870 Transcript_38837/m.92870 type:complete len:211 (+) Transcript_38837:45-677(+)